MDNNTYSLLVYFTCPEDVSFYLIPDQDIDNNSWRNYFEMAQNRMVNARGEEDNEGQKFLMAAIVESFNKQDNDYFDPDSKIEWRSCLADHKIEKYDPIDKIITKVYYSGFYF